MLLFIVNKNINLVHPKNTEPKLGTIDSSAAFKMYIYRLGTYKYIIYYIPIIYSIVECEMKYELA